MKALLKLYRNLKKYILLILVTVSFVYLQVRANLELPNITSQIINNGILQNDIDYIWDKGLFMILVAGLGITASIAANYFASRTSMGLGRDIRVKLFEHIESFSLSEFSKFGASTLLTRTTNDVVQIQHSTQMLIMMLFNAIFTGIDALILAYAASPYLTRVLFIAIPIVFLAVAALIRPIILFSFKYKKK